MLLVLEVVSNSISFIPIFRVKKKQSDWKGKNLRSFLFFSVSTSFSLLFQDVGFEKNLTLDLGNGLRCHLENSKKIYPSVFYPSVFLY